MKKPHQLLLPLMGVAFLFTTGASIIDKETKTHVLGLDGKMEVVARQETSHHAELVKLLKDQREQVQILMQRVDALQRQTSQELAAPARPPTPVATSEPLQTTVPAIVPKVIDLPQAVKPEVAQPKAQEVAAPVPAAPSAATPAPIALAATPAPVVAKVTTPAPVAPSSPPLALIATRPLVMTAPTASQPTAASQAAPSAPASVASSASASTESVLSRLAFFVSACSVLLMLILLVRMKKGEDRIRKMIWKSEMGALREDLNQVRPQRASNPAGNPPGNPKIQVTGVLPKTNVS